LSPEAQRGWAWTDSGCVNSETHLSVGLAFRQANNLDASLSHLMRNSTYDW